MPRGGARPGAGRPKGSGKPAAVAKAEQKTNLGTPKFETAAEFAMWVVNNDELPLAIRLAAMKDALPFTNPKLAEVAQGKKAAKGAAADAASKGSRFGTPAAPRIAVDNTKA
jgi:hypothetical protein